MDKLTWTTIEADALDTQSRKLYDKLREANRVAKECKEAFEESVRDRADVPKGKKLVFGYRFGKLAVALDDDDAKPKSSGKAAMTLADYLKQQR